jgi:hypothetical protein
MTLIISRSFGLGCGVGPALLLGAAQTSPPVTLPGF